MGVSAFRVALRASIGFRDVLSFLLGIETVEGNPEPL